LPWHDEQFATPRGSETWQEVQSGAPDTGDDPVTAWQLPQSAVNEAEVARVCVVVVNGTAWFGCPGPLAWHPCELNEEEKQLGAAGFGPVPGPVTL
jgi:hypothetical protein